ncbi:unnamed protein product [Haemonchus placei]|uniref:ZP domain-containing protein n=1 Tax=Haemonchus placei TaxID=6290 RepID=A0A0N4WKS1_HAEPC|nr:unnamed protein product [Haemonchus placei]
MFYEPGVFFVDVVDNGIFPLTRTGSGVAPVDGAFVRIDVHGQVRTDEDTYAADASADACSKEQFISSLKYSVQRFSNPESFNFVPSSFKRSYFEHRCATRDDVRTKYLASSCSVYSVGAENNTADNEFKKNRVPVQKSRSQDSDHEIGNKEATMTPNLKFRDTEDDEFVEARDSEKVGISSNRNI